MTKFTWKILEVTAQGDLITHVKYFVTATDDQNTVETESNYYFKGTDIVTPLESVREQTIINWIKDETKVDDINIIEARLEEQLTELKSEKKVGFPWLANTFTPNI